MKTVALIPARGGSKGIPGKNIKIICGKPLIQYAIESALESKLISEIWVSSDDTAILEIAGIFKGIKLHRRADSMATDGSPVSETILEILKSPHQKFDALVLLQPTSPIRTGKQIDEAIGLLENNPKANSIISVCSLSDNHPARMYWKTNDELISIMPDLEEARRQDLEPAFVRNGSIYVVRSEAFLKQQKVMIKPSLGYVMPSFHLLNIDEKRDLLIAEALISAWKKGELK
jgi:CMP-N-acetylneuraminic acid synthetase